MSNLTKQQLYYYANRDKILQYRSEYYAENKKAINERSNKYFKSYYEKNKNTINERCKIYMRELRANMTEEQKKDYCTSDNKYKQNFIISFD